MKICFTTSLFGNASDTPGKFERIKGIDYLLFTDQEPSYFNTSWNTIKQESMSSNNAIEDTIRSSRYPKFMGKKILETMGLHYDFIFYCDAFMSPNPNKNWEEICGLLRSNDFGFIQTLHRSQGCLDGGILQECKDIIRCKKDTKRSIRRTLRLLRKLNPRIDLATPGYYENTMFGYDARNPLVSYFLDRFWEIYSTKEISYRDQPLWNFLLLHYSLKPLVSEFFNPLNRFPSPDMCRKNDQSDFYFTISGEYKGHQYC